MKPRLVLAAALLLPAWLLSNLRCSPAAPPRTASPDPPIVAGSERQVPLETAPEIVPPQTPPEKGVASQTAPEKAAAPQTAPDLFASTVRPILAGHCAPCHETGGVMYERLPFDHADVVAAHSSGVLKRIKAPDERAAIEKWLATLPKS